MAGISRDWRGRRCDRLLIADAQALAQEEEIYLIAPTFVFFPDEEDRPVENRLLMIYPGRGSSHRSCQVWRQYH